MNNTILNRDFIHPQDGWYQVEAKGYHPAAGDRKIIQVIDDKAIKSIADRFNADVSAAGFRNGSEMLIDREHFKHDMNKDTVAFGWARGAQARADGIYCRVDWTGSGQPSVDNGDYRFFSTEYTLAETESENVPEYEIPGAVRRTFPGWRFMRPLRLDGLTLTNMHNNRGQRPITNSDRSSNILQADTQEKINSLILVARKLGLPAYASGEVILGELANVLYRVTRAEADARAIAHDRDAFKHRLSNLERSIADSDLDEFGIVDLTERMEFRPLLITNRETTRRMLASSKDNSLKDPRSVACTMRNRLQLQREAIEAETVPGRTHEAAYQAAKTKNPGLFNIQAR